MQAPQRDDALHWRLIAYESLLLASGTRFRCWLVALLMDLRAQFIKIKSFSLVLDSFFYECSLTLSASSDSAYRSLTKPGRDAIRAG